jgi:hypothetical protein
MKNILYVVAVLLIAGWAIGFILYDISHLLFHMLLVIAVIAIAINIYKHKKIDR